MEKRYAKGDIVVCKSGYHAGKSFVVSSYCEWGCCIMTITGETIKKELLALARNEAVCWMED